MARILLPTDFSANADHAAGYAIHLFGMGGNTFTLLHAHSNVGYGDPLAGSFMVDMVGAAREDLHEAADRFRKHHPGVALQEHLVIGPLATALHTYAEDNGADVIVMGMSGKGGARLFGSNTSAVLRGSPTPVIAVPDFRGMHPLRRILLADDHQVVAEADLAFVRDLALHHGAEVLVAHVVPQEEAGGGHWSKSIYELGLRGVTTRFIEVPGTDVATALEQAAEHHGVGLVAVLHRHAAFVDRLFHSSVAKAMAKLTTYPLLVLQQKG
ncbi:MAG TPA: universal stress protein [Flavobacteriales bacterium]|nr:universal stress protein [Flavobacteriales bacterium]